MSGSEAFGVVVRSIALLTVMYGLWLLWSGFGYSVGVAKPDNEKLSGKDYIYAGIGFAISGILLFACAHAIVEIAYGNPPR